MAGAGAAIVEPLLPPRDAAFVTKARHSVFYETPLDYLLRGCGVEKHGEAGRLAEIDVSNP